MDMRALGSTGLSTAPLVFGGNVLGWTADEATSFAVLDAFVDHGFNAIDTADVYSSWAPGNSGGESESTIGRWLAARPGMREKVTIFTKVGSDMGKPGHKGLKPDWIHEAVEESLKRLGVDEIDLYFSHWPDPDASYDETLGAYDTLLKAGKIRAIGASNLDAAQMAEAKAVATDEGLPSYQVLQPPYNLYDRTSFEGPLQQFCIDNGVGVVSYYGLASGFLTGKYRSKDDFKKSARGGGMDKYMTARGTAILGALDAVAGGHGAEPGEVALAWLMTRDGLTAPIVSATSTSQVESFARAAELTLTDEDLTTLDGAST